MREFASKKDAEVDLSKSFPIVLKDLFTGMNWKKTLSFLSSAVS